MSLLKTEEGPQSGDLAWISVKDIGPAPETGESFLLLFPGGEVSVGYWDAYYAEGGRGCINGYAWIEPCSAEALDLLYDPHTHWMILPKEPT